MVWILLGIGLLLIIFNIRAIKKEKKSFKNVFKHAEEDMEEFDIKLSELRREFSETILELQKEIVILKENYGSSNNINNDIIRAVDYKENHSNDIKESKIKEEHSNDIKESKIKEEHSNDIILSEIKEENNTYLNNLVETKIMEENKVYEQAIAKQEVEVKSDDEIMDNKENSSNIKENTINNDNELSNNIKIDEINKLLALGLSIEEISEKLSIGRGEVLLIKELYIR